MTPATSQIPKNLRERIGPAVWLLAILVRFTSADWNGDEPAYVASGNVMSDSELAEHLGVSERTISSWRRRLRRAGLIGWLSAPGQGRVFWIAPLNLIFGRASGKSERKRLVLRSLCFSHVRAGRRTCAFSFSAKPSIEKKHDISLRLAPLIKDSMSRAIHLGVGLEAARTTAGWIGRNRRPALRR